MPSGHALTCPGEQSTVTGTARRREPRPGPRPARRGPGTRLLRAAPGGVLRLPLPRRTAALRSSRPPGTRLSSAQPRVGPHRPGRSEPRAGRGGTDDGAVREARGLKHRVQHERRSVPIPPALVTLLRAHLVRVFGCRCPLADVDVVRPLSAAAVPVPVGEASTSCPTAHAGLPIGHLALEPGWAAFTLGQVGRRDRCRGVPADAAAVRLVERLVRTRPLPPRVR